MLSDDEFRALARLARLDPTDESLAGLRDDLSKILDYVEAINRVDTSAAGEAYTLNDTRNVVRSDESGEVLRPSEIGNFAPQWEAGHFVVPGILENES